MLKISGNTQFIVKAAGLSGLDLKIIVNRLLAHGQLRRIIIKHALAEFMLHLFFDRAADEIYLIDIVLARAETDLHRIARFWLHRTDIIFRLVTE